MPRKPCYWTRQLELDLVKFIQQREFIWKPFGNTNYHIQQKYKAYAEFAAKLGRGFTARSVRDRWVNIRSTFNHNLRRVDKSKESAATSSDVYVPCWPLWKPLQFLREVSKKEDVSFKNYQTIQTSKLRAPSIIVKEEPTEINDSHLLVRQRGERTNRPRHKAKLTTTQKNNKCKRVIEDLVRAMKPLVNMSHEASDQSYWFFGKHITERLSCMRQIDAKCAGRDIMTLLQEWSQSAISPKSFSLNVVGSGDNCLFNAEVYQPDGDIKAETLIG